MGKLIAAALAAPMLALAVMLGSLFSFTYTGTTLTVTAAAVDTTSTHVFVKLWNNCTSTAYVAFSSGVTAANGIPVAAGGWIEFDEETSAGNRLFGITAAGTCDVRVLEKKRP